MKDFGWLRQEAFTSLGVLLGLLAGCPLVADSTAQRREAPTELSCRDQLSDGAYAEAPVSRARLEPAAMDPSFGPRIRQLAESLRWAKQIRHHSYDALASGLRNGAFNPSPPTALPVPVSLRAEKGRRALIDSLRDNFIEVPSEDVTDWLEEHLQQFPVVALLPKDEARLSFVLSEAAAMGAQLFVRNHFSSYRHGFLLLAREHWADIEDPRIDKRKPLTVKEINERLLKEYVASDYSDMLKHFMSRFLAQTYGQWYACTQSDTCDPLQIIETNMVAHARQYFDGEFEKKNLVQQALIYTFFGDEEPLTGSQLRHHLLSALNTEILEVLANYEQYRKATPSITIHNPQEIKGTPAPISKPSVAPSRQAVRPTSISRKRRIRMEAEKKQQEQEVERASVAERHPLPELTDDRLAAVNGALDELSSLHNIRFSVAIRLTERLLGPYTLSNSGTSHYVFHSPFDRGLFVLVKHGKDLPPEEVRAIRKLVQQLKEAYGIDE